MRNNNLFKCGLALLAGTLSVYAQEAGIVRWESAMPHAGISVAPQSATFNFIASSPGHEISQIKNAPFSATGVTEFRQTLGDGTVIQRNSTSKLARDSEGRTRTEQSLLGIGAMTPPADMPQLISIFDPAANQSIMLDEKNQIAVVTKLPKLEKFFFGGGEVAYPHSPGSPEPAQADVEVFEHKIGIKVAKAGEIAETEVNIGGTTGDRPFMFSNSKNEATQEDLGTQPMEGVLARGTRTTTTIPVGAIGNSRAISVVRESWFSPDLETIVMSKSSDPQSGETTYRLTNIRRVEPDPSLFVAPAGYTVQVEPSFSRINIGKKLTGK